MKLPLLSGRQVLAALQRLGFIEIHQPELRDFTRRVAAFGAHGFQQPGGWVPKTPALPETRRPALGPAIPTGWYYYHSSRPAKPGRFRFRRQSCARLL